MKNVILVAVGLVIVQAMKPMERKIRAVGMPWWDSAVHWRLYQEVNFHQVLKVPLDSLGTWRSEALNDDSMHTFLSYAHQIVDVRPVFMGCYLASCEDRQGKLYKIVVSQYGGFLWRESDKQYYEVDRSMSDDWLTYFRQSYLRFNNQ